VKVEPKWIAAFDPKTNELVQLLDDNDSCHPYAGGDYNGHCGGCGTCMLMQAAHYGLTLKNVEPVGYETVGDALGRMEKG